MTFEELFEGRYSQLAQFIEHDDEGFFIDSMSFKQKNISIDPALVRLEFENALKRLNHSSQTRYSHTICCTEFEFSKNEVERLFSGVIWITELLLDPSRQIPFELGKKYQVLQEITSHRVGEEFEVLYQPRYKFNSNTYDRACHVGCYPKDINMIGSDISRASTSFLDCFKLVGEINLEERRKERRHDRT